MASALSQEANYPNRPVKIIVPFGAGASADILARTIGEKLAAKFGQPFVVENKLGAGGVIGTSFVAKSAPDGYTLLLTSSSPLVLSPMIDKTATYRPDKDFEPVALLSTTAFLLVSNPSVPAKNLSELVALFKKNPGRYSFASSGTGSYAHVGGELFKRVTGTDLVHIPYKGGPQAEADVMGGQVTVMLDAISTGHELVKSGKLRSYGVSSATQDAAVPDQTPIAKQGVAGLKDYNVVAWLALLAPQGTPPAVVGRLQVAIRDLLADPQFRANGQKRSIIYVKPDDVGAVRSYIQRDVPMWSSVIKSANIRID